MIEEMNLIETTPEYNVFEGEYDGTKQIMRFRHDGSLFEIKFTDDFARANGYKNRIAMAKETGVYEYLCAFYGGLPDWVHLNGEGEYSFFIPGSTSTLN